MRFDVLFQRKHLPDCRFAIILFSISFKNLNLHFEILEEERGCEEGSSRKDAWTEAAVAQDPESSEEGLILRTIRK